MKNYLFLSLTICSLANYCYSQHHIGEGHKAVHPLIEGIDHIPIVVRDLDSTASFYQQLGFALKPGRFHDNGIRNRHVKFKNGTELELITSSQAVDTLSTEYFNSLKEGEGPRFFGLFSTDIAGVTKQLDGYTNYNDHNKTFITFPPSDPLHLLFFGGPAGRQHR